MHLQIADDIITRRAASTRYLRHRLVAALLVVTTVACSTKEDTKAPTTVAATASAAPTTTAANNSIPGSETTPKNMRGMAMTGDPDHDFLRMMMDHHKGLVAMAHETIKSKKPLGVKSLATRLDAEQDKDMDRMSTVLDSVFKDNYSPSVSPDHQAMADQLLGKSGADFDTTFLQNVVRHHKEALKMIEAYLPNAKMPLVKAMAERIQATEQQEIAELEKRIGKAMRR